jgi:hypothetical protein
MESVHHVLGLTHIGYVDVLLLQEVLHHLGNTMDAVLRTSTLNDADQGTTDGLAVLRDAEELNID